jgi:Histidine kinase-like ATPase domain
MVSPTTSDESWLGPIREHTSPEAGALWPPSLGKRSDKTPAAIKGDATDAQHEPRRAVRWLRFDLPVSLKSTTEARHRVRAFDAIADGLRPDLELLLTEAVANVARHSGLSEADTMQIEVAVAPGYAWVEVSNAGRPIPEFRPPIQQPALGGGLGLLLIDRLASRWGTVSGPGATVWFELEEGDGPGAPGSAE